MVTSGAEPRDKADMREAGKLAVSLLKQLAAMLPLRSDTAKINDEIARIERVFNEGASDG
jgi:hypothetical protein